MVPNALLRWTILASAMVANRLEPILELFIGWRAEARVVPMECAKRHIGEVVWNRTGQLVGVEVQMPQAPEVAQFGRNRTGQRVTVAEVQIPRQAPEVAQFGRNRTGQLVAVELQKPQTLEVAQFGRNRTGQRVAAEVQPLQAPEVAQFGRNRTGQRVAVEVQIPQAPEVAQFGRNRTGQLVGA